jgi:hypothetical protein
MKLSARNGLAGTVRSTKLGSVMAEVVVVVDAATLTAAITLVRGVAVASGGRPRARDRQSNRGHDCQRRLKTLRKVPFSSAVSPLTIANVPGTREALAGWFGTEGPASAAESSPRNRECD